MDDLERQLFDALTRAAADGHLVPGTDVATEVAHLLALNHGLGTSILIRQRTVEEAEAVLRRHLDRLFGAGPQSTRTVR
ncbi:TetR family transcriptional regulator C-terminal domain-containing protein [Amycolatopsis vastitatis]|uniref:TetR family transcriptional regulator C-terminal domain-containing protein n=1 Tax=Amycolatopsis vastitatis TaxID=1905142 RepID=UPI001F0A1B01|nr:TetR family transcriptional regulator C-terminal domain-containing protein [Amycolatopsis vastitatis]